MGLGFYFHFFYAIILDTHGIGGRRWILPSWIGFHSLTLVSKRLQFLVGQEQEPELPRYLKVLSNKEKLANSWLLKFQLLVSRLEKVCPRMKRLESLLYNIGLKQWVHSSGKLYYWMWSRRYMTLFLFIILSVGRLILAIVMAIIFSFIMQHGSTAGAGSPSFTGNDNRNNNKMN